MDHFKLYLLVSIFITTAVATNLTAAAKISSEEEEFLREIAVGTQGDWGKFEGLDQVTQEDMPVTPAAPTMAASASTERVSSEKTPKITGSRELIDAVKNSDGAEVRRLLTEVNANAKDEAGNTLLHIAIDKGDLVIVKALLDAGASLKVPNKEGKMVEQLAKDKLESITKKIKNFPKTQTHLFPELNSLKNKELAYSQILSFINKATKRKAS